MRRSLPVTYLGINVACALVMLAAVHHVASVMAMEQRTVADGVDSITFFTQSAMAWAIAALANVAWICLALIDLVRRRGGQAFWWLAAAVGVWGVAFLASRVIAN
jgi:hypothetical protein